MHRAGQHREQDVVVGSGQPFQDADGGLDRLANDPGGLDAADLALALECQAGQPAPVGAAAFVGGGAQATAGEVFDYWREGLFRLCIIPPPASSPWLLAASQATVAGVSRRVTLAWLSWKLWSETRVSRAVDWNSGSVTEPQDTIVVLSLAMVTASPSLRSPA